MYKIFILDVALLNTFLVAADTDYINAIVSKGHTHLLINQAEKSLTVTLEFLRSF